MAQDNKQEFDGSFIEVLLFGLFKINIANLIKVKAALSKEFHIQPSEIDLMPFWEYELFVQEINNAVKEDNKRQEQGSSSENLQNVPGYKEVMAAQRMSKSNMKMPSMPSMPKI